MNNQDIPKTLITAGLLGLLIMITLLSGCSIYPDLSKYKDDGLDDAMKFCLKKSFNYVNHYPLNKELMDVICEGKSPKKYYFFEAKYE